MHQSHIMTQPEFIQNNLNKSDWDITKDKCDSTRAHRRHLAANEKHENKRKIYCTNVHLRIIEILITLMYNLSAVTAAVTRERHNTGAGNHPWAMQGKEQGPWRRERGHNGGHQGAHAGGACHNRGTSTAPPPANTARPPESHAPITRRRSTNRTPYGPHRLTPTGHQKPHRGRRAHLHGEKRATAKEEAAENTAAQPATTPSPPGDNPGHSEGHLTGTGRGRGRGHSAQGWRQGSPDDTWPKHSPPGRATPRTSERPTSPSGAPRPQKHGPSEPPHT